MQNNALPHELSEKVEKILSYLKSYPSMAIAFSGGVDSAVLAQLCVESGIPCRAYTSISASMPQREPERIEQLAAEIGIEHTFIHTDETSLTQYRQNYSRRCYYCKRYILGKLLAAAAEAGFKNLAEGSNADDLLDFRPGFQAVKEMSVLSPLVEGKLNKKEIRLLARYGNLSVAERPSTPCLSSRIAHGVEITPERLHKIDMAEAYLLDLGVSPLRVRLLDFEIASIETSNQWISFLAEEEHRLELAQYFMSLGFSRVYLSLTEFRSGSFNFAHE